MRLVKKSRVITHCCLISVIKTSESVSKKKSAQNQTQLIILTNDWSENNNIKQNDINMSLPGMAQRKMLNVMSNS